MNEYDDLIQSLEEKSIELKGNSPLRTPTNGRWKLNGKSNLKISKKNFKTKIINFSNAKPN